MSRNTIKTKKPCQFTEGSKGCACTDQAVKGEKYCLKHRAVMLQRMAADGYLQPLPDDERPATLAEVDWDAVESSHEG